MNNAITVYLTHCTRIKRDSLKATGKAVSPDELYIGKKIQRFMTRCKDAGVNWAIFSDQYDVWFPHVRHKWYEKHPDQVTDKEFKGLVENSVAKLKKYDVVYFYGNHKSRYFHKFYKKIIDALRKRRINIVKICHLDKIA